MRASSFISERNEEMVVEEWEVRERVREGHHAILIWQLPLSPPLPMFIMGH